MSDEINMILVEATPENPRNTEGDIIQLADGRLLVAWSDFYSGEMPDDAPARISAMHSEDQGRTWGERFTLQENVGEQNVMSVSFLRLASDELLLFYLVKNSNVDLQLVMRRSSDEAQSWSDSVMVTDGDGYYVVNNARIVQLGSKRLIAPASRHADIGGERRQGVAVVYYSDDEGRTWHKSETRIPLPGAGAQEPGVVELADGRLLMIIRNSLGRIHKSYSSDEGIAWSEAEPMDIRAPVAPSTITRIPSTGDLLLVWNDCFRDSPEAEAVRRPLTAAVSGDEGETWEHRRDLETAEPYWYAYTSVTFVDDRALLTYWVHDRTTDPNLLHLKFRNLPVSWFYEAE